MPCNCCTVARSTTRGNRCKKSYLASILRVSAPDGEIKVDPALVEYLYSFSLRWHHEGNFQCLKLKVGASCKLMAEKRPALSSAKSVGQQWPRHALNRKLGPKHFKQKYTPDPKPLRKEFLTGKDRPQDQGDLPASHPHGIPRQLLFCGFKGFWVYGSGFRV